MQQVSVRNGFADRNGFNSLNTEIQIKSLEEYTRIQIINLIISIYEAVFSRDMAYPPPKQKFFRFLIRDVYSMTIKPDYIYDGDIIFEDIRENIINDEFYNVLTIVEKIAQYFHGYLTETMGVRYDISFPNIYTLFNNLFQREYVGYRFIDEFISPISDDEEVETINDSLKNRFVAVREHISKANRLLSDREQPDYENSIKESISAVEAICQELLKDSGKQATLGKMLKRLEDEGIEMHSAMKEAFTKLYGYTSDANGIRHAGDIGGPSSTFEEAKFMLVSCSAFINYLMGVSAKL